MKPTPAAKAAKSTAFPPEIIEVEEALVQDSTWWYFFDNHDDDDDDEFFDGLGEVYTYLFLLMMMMTFLMV